MDELTQKKQKLDSYGPLPPELVKNLKDWFRVELTYTSNAIEGNTLTRQETALILEKGITVEGRTLTEHLEAINHAQALDFIETLAEKKREELFQPDILAIHGFILAKIDYANAGRYRSVPVRIAGSRVIMPNPARVPQLMGEFEKWLHSPNEYHPVKLAADAHYKLVSIHPFIDGNGRVSRLLMDLLLIQSGYPPALIRKEDRGRYINSLEKGQLGGSLQDYYKFIIEAVDRSLNIYLEGLEDKKIGGLLQIGKLAKETGETIHTLRYWTKEGLLEVKALTKGNYQLYGPSTIERVKEIRQLQKEKRLTIGEIKDKIRLLAFAS